MVVIRMKVAEMCGREVTASRVRRILRFLSQRDRVSDRITGYREKLLPKLSPRWKPLVREDYLAT
jgi:hypothetical protein